MAQDPPHTPLHPSLEYALYTLARIRSVGGYEQTAFRESLDAHMAHIIELWWDADSLDHDSYHAGKSATWEPVTSLEGLQSAGKLVNLAIRHSDVDSLSPIEGLKLQMLYLDHNSRLQDIAPIATLERLERLRLNHTAVCSLDALGSLKRLRDVQVMGLDLDDAAIGVLADLEERRVKLMLDPEARERVDQVRAERAAAADLSKEDPVAEELAALGLGVIAELWSQGIGATDVEGKTCLHHLVEVPEDRLEQEALIRLTHLMCQRGDHTHDLCFPQYTSKDTPLGMAIGRWPRNPPLVAALVEHTTRWDVPLDRPPAARALESGSDKPEAKQIVESVTQFDMALIPTASLVMACSKGRLDLVKAAIGSGARPDPPDHEETPLWAAVTHDHLHIAEYLLQAGANPNRRSANLRMSPPTHGCKSVEMLELLHAHGADPTALDVYGHTALTRIVNHSKEGDALVQRLIAYGCPVREVDGALLTWVHSAPEPDDVKARRELLDAHGAWLDPNRLDYGARDSTQGHDLKAATDPFGLKTAKLPTHFKQLVKLYNQPKKSGELEPGSLKWSIAIKLMRHMHHPIKGVESYDWLRSKVDAAIRAHAADDEVSAQIAALPSTIRRRLAAMLWIKGPEARDDIGYSALDYIVHTDDPFHPTKSLTVKDMEAHTQVALAMIEAGATPGFDHFGRHTLTRAFGWGGLFGKIAHTELFDALCEPEAAVQILHHLLFNHTQPHGAPDAQHVWLGERAMALATIYGCAEYFIGRLCGLLEAGQVQQLLDTTPARADGIRLSRNDTCPLGAAAARGRADVVRVLLDAGADIEGVPGASTDSLAWPLGVASVPEVARVLCEAGADIHARRGSLHGAISVASAAVFNLMNIGDEGPDYIGVLDVLRDAKADFDMPSARKPGARDLLESCLEQKDSFHEERDRKIRTFLSTLPERVKP